MFGLTRHRMIEIGAALLLTLAALLFVALTVWAKPMSEPSPAETSGEPARP
ncbi:MAG: hypothetical protein ABWY38_05775 [Methyloceanibacter sp.]